MKQKTGDEEEALALWFKAWEFWKEKWRKTS